MTRPDARRRPGPLAALLLSLALAATALPLSPSPLGAHGDAVLELASSSVAAGAELAVEGSEFETGSSYRLRLVGALDEHEIREVRPDAEGAFSLRLRIPDAVDEGPWELVAVAPDGDVVARATLTVVGSSSAAGSAGESSAPASGAAPGSGGDDGARADDMDVQRDRSGAEWGAIGLLVGLAGGLGIGLLRG